MPTTTINLTGQALSRVNDTNVTLTLGGTPLTSLLKATSLTLGWAGQLAVSRGGTGASTFGGTNRVLLTPTADVLSSSANFTYNGTTNALSVGVLASGILQINDTANEIYLGISNLTQASELNITQTTAGVAHTPDGGVNYYGIQGTSTETKLLVGTTVYTMPTDGTANQFLKTNGAGALSWGSVVTSVNGSSGAITSIGVTTSPLSQFAATTSAQLAGIISDETGSGALVFGTSPTITTSLNLSYGTASTVVYLDASKNLISLANGTGVLTNNGTGTLSWAAASSGITIGTTTITSGTANRVLYQSSVGATVTQTANFTMDAVATGYLDVPTGYSLGGNIFARMSTANGSCTVGSSQPSPYSLAGMTLFGVSAGRLVSAGSNDAFGDRALFTCGAGVSNAAFGKQSLYQATGSYNTGFGYESGYDITSASYTTCIGSRAWGGNFSSSIALGYYAKITANNQCIIGSDDTNGSVTDVWFGQGALKASPAGVTLHSTNGTGTNNAGAPMTIITGLATGTGASGRWSLKTGAKGSSGTTTQTAGDRIVVEGKYVDLTETTNSQFVQVNIPTGTTAMLEVMGAIEATDGTDYQSLPVSYNVWVVNKAGTLTFVEDDATAASTAASSSVATLTAAVSAADGGSGNLLIRCNATSSLAQTTLRISFQIRKNFGTGTITTS